MNCSDKVPDDDDDTGTTTTTTMLKQISTLDSRQGPLAADTRTFL